MIHPFAARALGLLVLFLLPALVPEVGAQRLEEFERSAYNRAAYYNYSDPGDVTILVNVWGNVPNPGLYEVPVGTRLGTVLSLAGGPSTGATRWNVQERTTLRIVRQEGGAEQVVFERTMEDEVFVPSADPELHDNDTVTVERYTRERFTWREALTIVSAGASFALLVDRVVNLAN